jgi:hypothetical protein
LTTHPRVFLFYYYVCTTVVKKKKKKKKTLGWVVNGGSRHAEQQGELIPRS